MTLPFDRARAVLAMKAAGVPQRKIAAKLGIARSSVQRILGGRSRHDVAGHVEPDADPDFDGKAQRCEGCGRMVIFPAGASECLACQVEQHGPTPAEAACDVPAPEPEAVTAAELLAGVHIPLELKPRDRVRYEQVHRRRLAAEMISAGEDGQPADDAGPTPAELAALEAEEGEPDR